MAKDRPPPLPWTQFSYDDFFRDHAVACMTNEEVGAYLHLLHAAWTSYPPGWIPDDPEYLASVSRLGPAWAEHAQSILRAFRRKDDHLEQKRIIEEYRAYAKRHENDSARGVAAARVRWSKHASRMQAACSTMPDVDVDVDVDVEKETKKEESKAKDVRKSARPAFVRPTLEEVTAYCAERLEAGKPPVDPEQWFDRYTSNGWRVGRSAMKDWRAAVRTWEKNDFQSPAGSTSDAAWERWKKGGKP